jgi:hypothetical protein
MELGVKTHPITIDVHVEKTIAHDDSMNSGNSPSAQGRAM